MPTSDSNLDDIKLVVLWTQPTDRHTNRQKVTEAMQFNYFFAFHTPLYICERKKKTERKRQKKTERKRQKEKDSSMCHVAA